MDSDKIDKVCRELMSASGNQWEGDLKRNRRLRVTEQPEDVISYSGPRGFRAETAAAAHRLAEAYVAIGAVTLRRSVLSYASMRSDRAVTVQVGVLEALRRRDPRLAKEPLGDITSAEFSGLAQTGLVEPHATRPKLAILSDEACDAIRLLLVIMHANRRKTATT